VTTAPAQPTVRTKEISFPVTVEWLGGRRVLACVHGKPELTVSPPPVFRGTDPHAWSPEDLFVASAATCLAVTFTGLAERAAIHLASLHVGAAGVVGRRDDGRFGFTGTRLELRVAVGPGDLDVAAELARQAEERCLVSASFALPVEVEIDVRAAGGD
jgi:organic hydroperoxide reductase OsmC/OhrA